MSEVTTAVSDVLNAVVVDYASGPALDGCLTSLRADGVSEIVVVDNAGATDDSVGAQRGTALVRTEVNVGYGAGVNRGAAALSPRPLLLVSNPDVVVHPGAVRALVAFLDEHPEVGLVGPTIVTSRGETYPSVRIFPNVVLAGIHAIAAPLWPNNPATRRYRSPGRDGRVDWVSGAFFVVRRELFEQIGGFDESYFMFGEEMDLCWRVGRTGARVAVCPAAVVTHIEGVSRQHAPRAMLIAHHRGAIRFELSTARGARRLLAPLAVLVLGARLGALLCASALAGRRAAHRG